MPELPEVETVRQGLEARLKDRIISEVEVRMPKIIKGDAALFAERAAGRRVVGLRRKGKIYLIDLGDYLIAGHLKMTGKYFFVTPGNSPGEAQPRRFPHPGGRLRGPLQRPAPIRLAGPAHPG